MSEQKRIKVSEMQLGDVVFLPRRDTDQATAYAHATVIKIDKAEPNQMPYERQVTLFRPYVHTSDFEYTGGIIPYTGFEQYKIAFDCSLEYVLVERLSKPLK